MNSLSPCKKICKIGFGGKYCLGCNRTIYEISNWGKFSDKKKHSIIKKLKKRNFDK